MEQLNHKAITEREMFLKEKNRRIFPMMYVLYKLDIVSEHYLGTEYYYILTGQT